MTHAFVIGALIFGFLIGVFCMTVAPPGHRDDPTMGKCYQRTGYYGGMRGHYTYTEIACP